MKILKPRALKPGSTLGVIACSTPINVSSNEIIKRAFSRLHSYGFKTIEAANCRTNTGHTAGTIKDRVKAIHDFFRNPKIDGILNYWGGMQAHQLLEYLDFDLIKKNPKPFIGYSDTTALHVGIHSQTGLVTFSGPAGISFGKPTFPDFSWEHFENVLMKPKKNFDFGVSKEYSDNAWYVEKDLQMKFQNNPGWKVFRPGTAQGKIMGGNIGTMLLLAGTKFWPKLKGSILFLEEDESESSKTVDRMFTQLRQMGVYDQIAGMVLGRFHKDVKLHEKDSLEMILDDALKGYKFPVITGVDFGHTDPLITFPLGIKCEINTRKQKISLLEPAVV